MATQSGIWTQKQMRDSLAGATYVQPPVIDGISGNLGVEATTLTISGSNFGLLQGTVRFASGIVVADVSVTPASNISMTVAVPQTIYELPAGTSVTIKFITASGAQSNNFTRTINAFTSEYLVVAGGAGAAGGANTYRGGGGGGAGGYRTASGFILATGNAYTVTVGAGGSGDNVTSILNTNGSDSVFSSITSTGGGTAGERQSNVTDAVGENGGSGGGATAWFPGGSTLGGSGNTPSVTPSQGNNGGTANVETGGGGGGGAGGNGGNGVYRSSGGAGGAGASNSITGASVTYATGGAGGSATGNNNGSNGSANTGNGGNGGGGSNNDPSTQGGAGGSGIVIVKYPDTFTISNPGGGLTFTTTSSSGLKITSFTAGTGSVQFS